MESFGTQLSTLQLERGGALLAQLGQWLTSVTIGGLLLAEHPERAQTPSALQ